MAHVRSPKMTAFCIVSAFVGTLLILHPLAMFAQAPSFKPAVYYSSGAYEPTSVVVVDVNGDGILDIVAANQCTEYDACPDGSQVCTSADYCSHSAVSVLLGNGDGTFQPAVTYQTNGYLSHSVALGDLNGDGKLDIVVVNFCGAVPIDSEFVCPYASVDVMYGNGDGTFGPPWSGTLNGWKPFSVALGDLDGDGLPDIVVCDICITQPTCYGGFSCECPTGSVEVLGRVYASGAPWGRSVALGDVNGDGKLDVAVGPGGLLLGNGDGTLKPVAYSVGDYVNVADVNSDGKLDLLSATSSWVSRLSVVSVLLGNGDGTFKPPVTTYPTGVYTQAIAVADVNADGRPDLVVGTFGGIGPDSRSLGVLIGKGNGTFQPVVPLDSGGGTLSVAVGDLNRDGKPDIVAVSGYGLGVLLNNTQTQKQTTSTTLASSRNPSIYGQNVVLTAKVTTTGPVPPTGTVVFTSSGIWGPFTVGTAALSASGIATLSKSDLNAGPYPLTAVYKGNASNAPGTSALLNQTVLQAKTSATITSSLNPSTVGQAVTFAARVSSPTVLPTGPVTFTAGTTVLGTAQLSGGKATFTTSSLPAGSNAIKVTYLGNSNIARGSARVTQVVQP